MQYREIQQNAAFPAVRADAGKEQRMRKKVPYGTAEEAEKTNFCVKAEREETAMSKKTGVIIAVAVAVVLLITAALLYVFVLKNMLAYSSAGELFNGGRYTDAKTAYLALDGYKDSADMARECDYRLAKDRFTAGELEEAETLFNALGNYKDSAAWANNCQGAIRIRDYEAAGELLENGLYDQARDAFLALDGYKDSEDMANECDYRKAVSLMEQGRTDEAQPIFESLYDYKDSATLADECAGNDRADKYASAEALLAAGRFDEAKEAFAALDGYKDSLDMTAECDYRKASSLLRDGDYTGAYELLLTLGGYKDADTLFEECVENMEYSEEEEEEPEEEPEEEEPALRNYSEADWRVGKYVAFGTYPATRTGTDSTPIEWQVLERNGDKAMLITRYVVDTQQYWEKVRTITWEDSSLRAWLNDTFLYKAFTAQEYAAIQTTLNDNSKKQQGFGLSGGNDTSDRIFVLSYAEVQKYFPEKASRKCLPTDYAEKQGVYVHERDRYTWWWTRSPGKSYSTASAVNYEGGNTNYATDRKSGGVRPVLWVDITKLP